MRTSRRPKRPSISNNPGLPHLHPWVTAGRWSQGARMARDGADEGEVVAYIQDWIDHARVIFAPLDLRFAKKSGRGVRGRPAFMGDALGLKPIMTFENGDSKVLSKVRGEKNVVPALLELCRKTRKPGTPYPGHRGEQPGAGRPSGGGERERTGGKRRDDLPHRAASSPSTPGPTSSAWSTGKNKQTDTAAPARDLRDGAGLFAAPAICAPDGKEGGSELNEMKLSWPERGQALGQAGDPAGPGGAGPVVAAGGWGSPCCPCLLPLWPPSSRRPSSIP